ncbi:MAG: hypothetical protein MJZ68_08150 [archaeon]|nr:hypothetical protein [archaeon]
MAVTGDVWDEDDLLRVADDPVIRSMTKKDFLIILGSCGVIEPRQDLWTKALRFRELPCGILFLGGEKEDYDVLEEHPLFPWNGGMIQNVSKLVFRLCRGQRFSLFGKSVLTLGGRSSEVREDIGKYWTWWPEQCPSSIEVELAISNSLENTDYIFTGDNPCSWKHSERPSSVALDGMVGKVSYCHWYFYGDEDREYPEHNATSVHHNVIPLS